MMSIKLSESMIKEILLALQEVKNGDVTEYEFG